jgi:hypothetical protein
VGLLLRSQLVDAHRYRAIGPGRSSRTSTRGEDAYKGERWYDYQPEHYCAPPRLQSLLEASRHNKLRESFFGRLRGPGLEAFTRSADGPYPLRDQVARFDKDFAAKASVPGKHRPPGAKRRYCQRTEGRDARSLHEATENTTILCPFFCIGLSVRYSVAPFWLGNAGDSRR